MICNSNIKDYLGSPQHICSGCVNCLKQQHKFIQFKYPKSIKTRYVELFRTNTPGMNSVSNKVVKVKQLISKPVTFNYD